MSDPEGWKRLEPASVLVNLLPTLWRTFRSLWYIVVPLVIGGSLQGAIDLGFVFLFLVLAVGRTILHWATLRYRLHAGRLEIVVGLIGQQHRVIDPARIQNLELVQNVFHRMAGLVELRLETAGDAGAEGLLSAISVAEAESLRAALDASRLGPGARAADAPEETVAEAAGALSLVELLGYGMSAGRVGAAVVTVSVVAELLGQATPQSPFPRFGQDPARLLGFLLVGFALAYASSVGTALLRFYHFRLVRGPRGLVTEAGLFTRRRIEIPPRKVQVLQVDEPVVRRLMGYATVQIETAASGAPGEERASEAMIPMVPTAEVGPILALVDEGLPPELVAGPLRPAAPRALLRALIGATVRWGLLALMLGSFGAGAWGLLLVGWGWASAWIDWRSQGWLLEGDWLVSRRGFPRRRTSVVNLGKVQSVHRHQGPLQRRHRLARLTVWVAGTRVDLPDLHEAEVEGLFDRIVARVRPAT